MDDVVKMEVSERHIATDTISSKLIYFANGDRSSGKIFALQGERRPAGARGLKGDSGDREL